MEQNRVLWIVGAVGAFLLVVVGAALLLYSPSQNADASMTSIENLDSTWVSQEPLNLAAVQPEQNTLNNTAPGLDPLQPNPGTTPLSQTGMQSGDEQIPNSVQSLNVYSGQTTVISGQTTAIDLNDITRVSGSPSAVHTQDSPINTLVQNNAGGSQVKTDAEQGAVKQSSSTLKQTSSQVNTPAKTSSAKTDSVKASAAVKAVSDKYWIQAASFTSKKNAEDLKTQLASEKINSEIFTFTDADSVMYYRVRVGPYSTKTEAEYWQNRIALVDKLSSAKTYITNSSAPKK